MGWATIIVFFIASFSLLGVVAIASEIEEPLGYDANDLNIILINSVNLSKVKWF
jgi:predicted membrane chloride channel (bestrophin family)